jgi:hypothetical protein
MRIDSTARSRLVQAIRSIPQDEREREIAAVLAEITDSDRRVALKRRFEKLPTDVMARMLADGS